MNNKILDSINADVKLKEERQRRYSYVYQLAESLLLPEANRIIDEGLKPLCRDLVDAAGKKYGYAIEIDYSSRFEDSRTWWIDIHFFKKEGFLFILTKPQYTKVFMRSQVGIRWKMENYPDVISQAEIDNMKSWTASHIERLKSEETAKRVANHLTEFKRGRDYLPPLIL